MDQPAVAPEAQMPAGTPQARTPFLKRRVSPGLAAVLVLAATAAFYLVFTEVGQAFFWSNYDTRPPQERAYEAALKRVQENPDNGEAHVSLGWALYQKGQHNEALAEYKRALDIDPRNYKAQYNLGLAYAKVDKWERAADQFQEAIRLAPNNYQPHYDLGLAYDHLGKLDDAQKELDLAYKLNPGSVDIIFAIGQVYEKRGDNQNAIFQYQSALSLDPNYARAREALSKLRKPAAAPEAGGIQ